MLAIELTFEPVLDEPGTKRRRSLPSCGWLLRDSNVERKLEMKGLAGDVGEADAGGGSSSHPVRDREAASTSERRTSAMLRRGFGSGSESPALLSHYAFFSLRALFNSASGCW